MFVVKTDPVSPDKETIARAAQIIRNGGLVIFPTETVYGIAANFTDDKAIKKLYEVKSRPDGKPFTVHISDLGMIKKMGCHVDDKAKKLIAKFWPGPLTIILNSDNGGKIGFRMPANKIAIELIRESKVPIVAPSANLSGHPAPSTAGDAMADFKEDIDMVIDGGKTDVGVESTVIDLTMGSLKILRKGAIKAEELLKVANG